MKKKLILSSSRNSGSGSRGEVLELEPRGKDEVWAQGPGEEVQAQGPGDDAGRKLFALEQSREIWKKGQLLLERLQSCGSRKQAALMLADLVSEVLSLAGTKQTAKEQTGTGSEQTRAGPSGTGTVC